MEAYQRLAGSDSNVEALSASNAAEAATTLAAVADMMLKMGEVEEASKSLTTSLDLLQQHPGQLPALQVASSPYSHHLSPHSCLSDSMACLCCMHACEIQHTCCVVSVLCAFCALLHGLHLQVGLRT